MKSGFIYSDDNKRYRTLNYEYRHRFGGKVSKVSLNGGFSCPNIDGTVGVGGCTYCCNGSGDFAGDATAPIKDQFDTVRARMDKKWSDARYIAYWQAFTNTHAPVAVLRSQFEQVLSYEGVVGISIATRADCLGDDVVEYLYELSQKTYLVVELGLQTIHDRTAKLINRGHDYNTFIVGYNKLKDRGINICVHIINGLPFETRQDMIESARRVGDLQPHIIKLHLLHIMEGTVMARQYNDGYFSLPTLEEYASIVCDQLRVIPPSVTIGRVTGDGDKERLIAPLWSLKKFTVINEIDKLMERNGYYQGDLL